MQTASTSSSNPAPSVHRDSPIASADRSFATSPYADLFKGKSSAPDCGSLQLTQSSTNYVNSAHWAAVLDGIADLKIHLDEEGEVQDDTPLDEFSVAERGGPQLLYGCTRPVTKEEILATIPERPVVDRLISGYFNSFDMSPGEYAKGGPYVLETLMLYIAVEVFLRSDAELGVWILLGTIVQLAMHMGYHRDPYHFPSMSPFIAEMRKRVWATVVELDIGLSTQMGLPRLIKHWQTDTGGPSNLHDNDFDPDTAAMPASRPETELTPMLYRLAKARMMTTIGFVWDLVTDTRQCPYTEIMKMDNMLQDAHSAIPPCLRWVSMAHCIMDSPQVIMQKVFLEIMFHRARIVLHQRYLHSWQADTQNGYSQQACLDAALKLLDYQHVLQEETQPFCRLYQERWRVSSLVNHDFLLATSILCSYLQRAHPQSKAGAGAVAEATIWTSLQKTYDIWVHSSSSSKEAQKAARALKVILGNRNCINIGKSNDETNSLLSHIPLASFHNHSICPDPQGNCGRHTFQTLP
ncbi:fungal specific transcription factor domain-containing protein [Aspergillus fischeri NRRL 181]|uniref:Fungal specific transcription factor, putative n=1 Tax=Neosartorya fischeri (strain ATCC 1020 / DSM 3700 / CBS 544.65 / FGSC A1164 / JCM 1740 / NRRL 181 / WB 181) TaxID=331117 RepID=A1DLG0_NEOFI|nr:fungal specific transcription factor, putative [Aspergillus fischeri NRRL 181]EAW15631.1 fungal specific transcription factor, putative [Aspergillus fischeri NRRL 181]